MENKRILITGKNSYIGKSFLEYVNSFDEYSVEAISVRGDEWQECDFTKYDVVINVAGVAHIKETEENRQLYYDVNRDLAVELAKKAKQCGVKQYIYLSSMSVFGIVEGRIFKDTKENPINTYGKSKLEAEKLLRELADSSFVVSIVRPPMVYGPGCKGNYQTLRKFALKVGAFPDIINQRSMISIDNLNKAILGIVKHPKNTIYHPQNPDFVCTYEMVKQIAESEGKRFHTIKVGKGLIRLFTKQLTIFKKVFGTLTYDMTMNVPLDWYGDRSIADTYDNDLVSIIMPMYNSELYIEEAIRSVQKQDYPKWELLVVNDGSTDSSPEIVTKMVRQDNRIILINKPNGGIASARNMGIEKAKGRYLAFLDSDDKWNCGKIGRQIKLMEKQNVVFCYTGTGFMEEDGTPLKKSWPVPKVVDYEKLLKANVIPCSSVLIDRKKLKPFKMPHQGHEDYATWLSILRDNGIKAIGISEPLFIYRKSNKGASGKKVKTLRWTWHVYHDSQHFGWWMSTFCFIRFEILTLYKYLVK